MSHGTPGSCALAKSFYLERVQIAGLKLIGKNEIEVKVDMGIIYLLANHSKKEFISMGKYAVNDKSWSTGKLSKLLSMMIQWHWLGDHVILQSDSYDEFYTIKESWKDMTDHYVEIFNEDAVSVDELILPANVHSDIITKYSKHFNKNLLRFKEKRK